MPRNAAAQAKQKSQNSDPIPNEDDVDKIRDIIFGGQMREYASRFDQLEERLGKTIDNLKNGFEARFEKLERSVENRLQQVNDRVASEREERKTALSSTRGQLRDIEKALKKQLAETDYGAVRESLTAPGFS